MEKFANANIMFAFVNILPDRTQRAMAMGKKSPPKEPDVERMLEAALEISSWQADLVRSALRQLRGRPGKGRESRHKSGK